MDKWDRKTNFNCYSCMYFVPKIESSTGGKSSEGRCRRSNPTLKGFPVVYADFDWCGEHKIGSNPVRDGKKEEIHRSAIDTVPPLTDEEIRGIEQENEIHRQVIAEEKAQIKAEIKVWLLDITGITNQYIHDLTTTGDLAVIHNGIHKLLEKL